MMLLLSLFSMIAVLQGPRPDRSVDALKRCDRPMASVPASWPVFAAPGTNLAFRPPPDAVRSDKPEIRCVHGCVEWRRGSLRVTVSYGIWGEQSFDEARWSTACVTTRSSIRVVEMSEPTGRSLVLWAVSEGKNRVNQNTADFLLSIAWTNDEDRADALRVADSFQRK